MQDNGGRGSRPLDHCVTAALKSAFADLDFRVHVISDICYESQNILQQIGRVLIHIPLPGISLAVTAARDLRSPRAIDYPAETGLIVSCNDLSVPFLSGDSE